MNILEYNLNQLSKTKGKKYENYVISRIIHGINHFEDIKFITQQYVKKTADGYYFTDLFFPQFELHIEIDENFHNSEDNVEKDKLRELEIIEATNHKFIRINISDLEFDINKINNQIDEIIKEIIYLRSKSNFKPWKIDDEFINESKKQHFFEKGYIQTNDNIRFRKIVDGCNFFGQDVRGMQKGWIRSKKYFGYYLWFPKFYNNSEWDNKLVDSELNGYGNFKYGDYIQEKRCNQDLMQKHYDDILKQDVKRIVLPRFIDNLGFISYKFMGIYEIERDLSSVKNGIIYKRISENFNL